MPYLYIYIIWCCGQKGIFEKWVVQFQLKITIESVDWNRFSIHLLCNFTTTILWNDLLTPASLYADFAKSQSGNYFSNIFLQFLNELLPMYSITWSMSRAGTRQTTRQWNPSTDGSKRRSSWISMSREKDRLKRKLLHTSLFSIRRVLHIH